MSPTGDGPEDLSGLRIDLLREAVRVYLAHAYPSGTLPDSVRKRLDWPAEIDAASLVGKPPFEKAGKNRTTGTAIYALRLGNCHYPHMKLQVQPWPNPAGFMLSVNTHDQVLALDPNTSDLPAFRLLQAENQTLKEKIEHAWDDAGLPTFLRYLRDYIGQRTGSEPNAELDDATT